MIILQIILGLIVTAICILFVYFPFSWIGKAILNFAGVDSDDSIIAASLGFLAVMLAMLILMIAFIIGDAVLQLFFLI
jgi:hypothetical protein